MAFAPASPIQIAQVAGGANAAHPSFQRLGEKASETGLVGAPVILSSGVYTESGTITDDTPLLAGFSSEDFHNLTTDETAKILSAGTPQNQPNATIIPMGAPLSDGLIGIYLALAENIFEGRFGSTVTATLPALSDVGKIYGLTIDTGFWFVDKAKTTAGAGAIVTIVGLHPEDERDGLTAGDRVLFVVSQANRLFDQ